MKIRNRNDLQRIHYETRRKINVIVARESWRRDKRSNAESGVYVDPRSMSLARNVAAKPRQYACLHDGRGRGVAGG